MRPLLDSMVGDLGPILLIAFSATGLLLLLAMVNVANLLLARGTARAREVAVRTALGATRWNAIRPLLAESLLIATAATAVALPLALAAVRAIALMGGAALPRVEGLQLDPRVFLFSAVLMLTAGVLVGIAPAATMAQVNLTDVMREGGRGGLQGRVTRRLLGAMVVVEVALAMALVAGGGRLLLSLQQLLAIDPGFTSEGRLAVDVLLPPQPYADPARLAAWSAEADRRLRAVGATEIGVASSLPLGHEWDSTTFVDITNRPTDPASRPNARLRIVSPGFFSVFEIAIVAGRPFTADDRLNGAPVAIVNRAWARKFIPDLDPLRERINPLRFVTRVGQRFVPQDAEIIGVVEDIPYADVTKAAEPTVYVSDDQVQTLRRSIVITAADGRPERLVPQIRTELEQLDPQVPVEFEPLSRAVSSSLIWPRLGVLLMVTFGVTALVLAATGVFGVIAFVTAQRSGEMAVRLALGATGGQVFRLIVLSGRGARDPGAGARLAAGVVDGRADGKLRLRGDAGKLAGPRRQRGHRPGGVARRDASVGAPGRDHAAGESAQALRREGEGRQPARQRCSIATAVATLFIASVARMMTLRPASLSSTTTSKSSRRESGMPSFG